MNTVLDPTGEQQASAREPLPPPPSLRGRTVGLLDISKARGDVVLDRLAELLRADGVEVRRYRKPTFARVAQVQLKSVLDALAEEVEKLGDLPRMPAPQQQQPSPPPQQQLAQISDVSWSVSVGASATTATTTSPFDPR